MDRKDWHKRGPLQLTLEEFPHWAGERLQFHDQMLAMLAAKTTAMEYGLAMAIGFHPEPERLLERWNQVRPDLVDAEMESPMYETEQFREVFQKTLATLTRTMEAACRRESPDQS